MSTPIKTAVLVVVSLLSMLEFSRAQSLKQPRYNKQTYPSEVKKSGKGLNALVRELGLEPLKSAPPQNPAAVILGQALFFDYELSGNRNIACATCHHPSLSGGDALPLSIGTSHLNLGRLGVARGIQPEQSFAPRNAPEIFNRGDRGWFSQYWDSRILQTADGFLSPAGEQLPSGMPNVLAIQAMFPVTSRAEMRGQVGDTDIFGQLNELALIPDSDFLGQWDAIMDRLLKIPEYQSLFGRAYPNISPSDLGFEHAAAAIAAFEAEAFTFTDSPWDQFLAGNKEALTSDQKRGAVLFFGKANCSTCHSGTLFTDQKHYNLGVPQLGPGKGLESPLDFGLGRESGAIEDRFRFRTPTLRNCSETSPYMHNGAYDKLDSVIRHHMNPLSSLIAYRPEQHISIPEIRVTYDASNQFPVANQIDEIAVPRLSDKEIGSLVAFLNALTAPKLKRKLRATIPNSVPSGLMDPLN
jgi:cytochrome c peroxidase